jgi:hypothetical protein
MWAQVLWNSPRSLPVAAGVAVLVVAAVVWLYPVQVKGLPAAWRWGLPGLRVAGLLALAAALLKPAMIRPRSGDDRGVVMVLVDRSRSMAVADNARTGAQLVSLAAGLGHLPPGVRSARAAAAGSRVAEVRPLLAAAERAAGDLDYARVAGRGVEAARERVARASDRLRQALADLARDSEALTDAAMRQRVAGLQELPAPDAGDFAAALSALRKRIDETAAAAAQVQAAADEKLYQSDPRVRAACDTIARLSRIDVAAEVLLRPGSGLLSQLGPDVPVVGFAFADELSPLPLPLPRTTLEVPATGPTSAPAIGAPPDGRRSDIAAAVRHASDRFADREVSAVVLFSDGRQAGVDDSVTSSLAASGTPVFPVALAPPAAVRDAAVTDVAAPASAFVGETATVRAELRAEGMQDTSVVVKLTAGDAAPQARTVTVSAARPTVAEFQVKLEPPGAQLLTVSFDAIPGEATGENNAARRWVKVLSQKVKVAAYAALPGWDFQYARNALSRTPWVELRSAVLNPAAPRVPPSPEQLLQEDVLILADVPVAALDEAQWGAVYRLVSERGGSVILLAGPAHTPAEYGQHLVASSLLPYTADFVPTWRMWPGEEPMFRLVPHPDALNEPALRLGGGAGATGVQRWQMLPGLYRILPLGRLKQSARPFLVEASSGEPILTRVRVGAGTSYLLGTNETWRWRATPGEDVLDRFWLQLVRQAAGEPFAARSERLALDVDRVGFDAGATAQVRVRATAGVAARALRLELLRADTPPRMLPLAPTGGPDSGLFRARVGPVPEGEYVLRLSETGADAAAALSVPLHVTADYETELADVSGDESVLRRLAEASGGEVFKPEQAGELARRLRSDDRRRPRYVEQRLWDSPYLFVLVVGCFAAEWAARKRLGLA